MAQANELRIAAQPRTVAGKQVRQLRREGVTPASLARKDQPVAIQVATKPLQTVLNYAGKTRLIQLEVGGTSHPVLVREVQRDPVSRQLLHVDFFEVNLREKTRASVPVELLGEAPGVKEGGLLVRGVATIDVEALPTDLPQVFEVDLSTLTAIGQSLFVRDLVVPSGVEVLTSGDEPVATVAATRVSRAEQLAEEAAAEAAATEAAPAEEGAAAEGAGEES